MEYTQNQTLELRFCLFVQSLLKRYIFKNINFEIYLPGILEITLLFIFMIIISTSLFWFQELFFIPTCKGLSAKRRIMRRSSRISHYPWLLFGLPNTQHSGLSKSLKALCRWKKHSWTFANAVSFIAQKKVHWWI